MAQLVPSSKAPRLPFARTAREEVREVDIDTALREAVAQFLDAPTAVDEDQSSRSWV